MSETDMSEFEAQFIGQHDVTGLVADMGMVGRAESIVPLVRIEAEEAIDLCDVLIDDISRSMDGNPRCTTEKTEEGDYITLFLDPDFDAEALNQPSLAGIRNLIVVTGPVNSSDQAISWSDVSVTLSGEDGTDTIYDLKHEEPPMIHTVGYDPDGLQGYMAPRTLNQNDLELLLDVVKALDCART